MSAAITWMHDDPAHRWTLQELAERVGMSRSIFALRFKKKVGATPMEYLTRWRMLLAGDRLKNSDDSLSVIASSLGYESESAFGKAFRRIMGCSPRQHSRGSSPATLTSTTTEASYDDQMEVATVRSRHQCWLMEHRTQRRVVCRRASRPASHPLDDVKQCKEGSREITPRRLSAAGSPL
jgi:AraC-like DNA-binding protein